MSKLTVKTASEQEFFKRGLAIAKLADATKRLPTERVVSFEDPADLLNLLTTSKLELLRAVKEAPGSITIIAAKLRRDRSAVKRDVDRLAEAGLVTVEVKTLPGHGRMKEVRAVADRFRLEAMVA